MKIVAEIPPECV